MINHIDLSSDDEDSNAVNNVRDLNIEDMPSSSPPPKTRKRKDKGESKAALLKKERELRAEERKKKQAMKPENRMKIIKVIASADLLQNDYAGDLILALNKAEIGYKVDVNPIVPSSISWELEDPLDEEPVARGDHVVVFMGAENFVNLVSSNKLTEKAREVQSFSKHGTFTLVIYELENYFRYQKTHKNREFQNEVRGQSSKNQPKKGGYSDAARVTREQVECSLAELQVLYKFGHRFFNTPSEVSSYICQYTKAVAEAPFRREKKSKDEGKMEWFAQGDSKSVVRVDKNCNGLARLWRQQLCQFNTAGLDASEAIAYVHPSPKALMEAYDKVIHEEAQLLLQNIQLRRGSGPLSSERRIGPQLSRNIHAFFSGLDGNIAIAEDE